MQNQAAQEDPGSVEMGIWGRELGSRCADDSRLVGSRPEPHSPLASPDDLHRNRDCRDRALGARVRMHGCAGAGNSIGSASHRLGPMALLIIDSVEQPRNFNPQPAPFGLLVQDLFLKLEATTPENKAPFATVSGKKTHIIEQFIHTWRTHFGPDLRDAVPLIFPNRDPRKYFIKDVALARLVTTMLGLQKGSADQIIIQNWKKSHLQKSRLAGAGERHQLRDFPMIVSRIMLRRRDKSAPVKSTVTVVEVKQVLERLSEHGTARTQAEILGPFLARLTIEEVRFFFLILLKELMLSFFERVFLTAWHPDAYELYKVCSDLGRVVAVLSDPARRPAPRDLHIQPMHQFIPQLSKKLDISYGSLCTRMAAKFEGTDELLRAVYEAMGAPGRFLIEEKIDGDRMLMHMHHGRFRWHTRRRRDYTLVYGETVHIGALTKHLSAAFHPNVSLVVLDGEMVAWDKDRHVILPFGTLRSAAVQEALKQFDVIDVYEGNNAWPFYLVFDIVHLNGHDLCNLPLFYRKHLLSQVLCPVPHRLEPLQWVLALQPHDLTRNMQRIVCEHNEGIMVKSLLSKYRVASRELTWIKVKPEYLEDFGENLDLVVIGKIGRVKTTYMCGLRDELEPGAFLSFCSVANGFLAAVYRQIESRLCTMWVDFVQTPPPAHLVQFGTKKPDFWINPANSIVLEIKARSIQVTAESPYAAGSTLHNLWCRSVRDDKGPEECVTLQEYRELLAHHLQDTHKKQTVNRDLRLVYNSVYERYPPEPLHMQIPLVSGLFRGLTFVVLTDARHANGHVDGVQDTHLLVKQHGAEIHLDPRADTLHGKRMVLIGDVETPRVKSLADEGFDIVRPQWIWECIQQGRLVRLEHQFMFRVSSRELRAAMRHRTDAFGDSYTVAAKDKQQCLAELMKIELKHDLSEASLAACVQATPVPLHRLFGGIKFAVFRGSAPRQSGRLIEGQTEGDEPGNGWKQGNAPGNGWKQGNERLIDEAMEQNIGRRVGRRIERFGGSLSSSWLECGYIVIPMGASRQQSAQHVREWLAGQYKEGVRLAYIVGEAFVNDSIREQRLMEVEPYVM